MIKLNLSDLHTKILRAHSFLPDVAGSSTALPPLIVQIDVTHRCDLRCSMCFQLKNADIGREMTCGQIKKIIDQLPLWSVVTFSGGEPFVRNDFREILRYALARRKCNILTNAGLVTAQDIDLFVSGGLLVIGISLDGLGETHDRIRGRKGLFEKVVGVIENLRAARQRKKTAYPLIDIKTVALRENVRELYKLFKSVQSWGADYFSLSLPKLFSMQFNEPYFDDISRIRDRAPDRPEAFSGDDTKALLEQVGLISKDNASGKILRQYPYDIFEPEGLLKYYGGRLTVRDFRQCRVPWSLICISPYGDVYPCMSYRTGSAVKDSIAEIWNGERYRLFRKNIRERGLFPGCVGCCYAVFKGGQGV
ncbi:MAG: radical SAM protein [Elusimicrobia bacterium]|nr:radical SAM protein [Elusimicrobiota bacterium]